jgi:hypothetical protein
LYNNCTSRSFCLDTSKHWKGRIYLMELSRTWAMPNSNTFEIKPIKKFVTKYLKDSALSIDPFARNCELATITNDLNPDTSAKHHLTARDFLFQIGKEITEYQMIIPDLVLFDPPYSIGQIKQCYNGVGLDFTQHDAQYMPSWVEERDIIKEFLAPNGVVLTFGWNTNGMGKSRGFEIVEIMLVAHGGPHNDTICMAERKLAS